MRKFPPEKILPVVFYVLLIVGIGVIGYVGMSRRASAPAPEATASDLTEAAKAIPLAGCEAATGKICILSTGYDAQGNLLISLKTALQPMPPVYARLTDDRLSIRFDCRIVDISPRLLYCLGPFGGDMATATLEIYTVDGDSLLASGLLIPAEVALVPQTTPVELPTELTLPTPTEEPVPYPNDTSPSYPSYPAYP